MTRDSRMEQFQTTLKSPKKRLFYDEDSGTFMGRTASGWGKLLIFYSIFYAVLISLFAICMATFMQHFINPRVPRLQQDYGLIGTSPGLGFRPMPPDVRSTLIWYKGTEYESFEYWEKQLINFLSEYKRKGQTAGAGQNMFNCDFDSPPPPGKVCDVDVRGWEPCIEEAHFNYHRSQPCIFLKLNRIFGWRPEFYDTKELPSEMPVDLQMYIRNITEFNRSYGDMIWVSCEGETAADRESLGPLQYLPAQGFPGYYYPYNNAEGYLSPLVAVHLLRPKTGILISIECRAWAKNIVFNRKEKLGVAHFELMIE